MRSSYQYEQRLKACFVGGGDHAYTNVLPCLQFLPIELVALCDEDRERGIAMARHHGVRRFYPNHSALLAKEQELDLAIIVAGPDEHGMPRYPELAKATLESGLHTWIDAPPCRSDKDITTFTDACIKSGGKFIMAGLRRPFCPAYAKAREIIESPAFGGVSSFSMRYPLVVPDATLRQNDTASQAALLEIVHPLSLLMDLFGDVTRAMMLRGSTGDAVLTLEFPRSVVGSLHLTGNQAATGPLERLEVIGHGAHVVVDNVTELTYYRSGGQRGSADSASFIGPDGAAPITWRPEFSLGRDYNKAIFLQGYYHNLAYFCEQLLEGESPKRAHLVHILQLMTLYDRIVQGQEGVWLGA